MPNLEEMSTLPGLESIELATTIAIGTLALLALAVPLAWYAIGAPAGGAVNRRGRGAQNGLMLVLAIAPLILAALGGGCFLDRVEEAAFGGYPGGVRQVGAADAAIPGMDGGAGSRSLCG